MVEKNYNDYFELGKLIKAGSDPDNAYKAVYSDKIIMKDRAEAVKADREANALKLKNNRPGGGTSGKKPEAGSFDEQFEEVWAEQNAS